MHPNVAPACGPSTSSSSGRSWSEDRVLLGGAILDDAGTMVGSTILADFETRDELDDWLRNDPYVTEGVWRHVEVHPFRTAVGAWMPDDDFRPEANSSA